MSTRATYQITTEKRDIRPVIFYIHCDGYPEGAMEYIKAGLLFENKRGTFIEQFMRANETAEITPSHNAHGDTEFTYDIVEKKDGQILVSCTDLNDVRTILMNVPVEKLIDDILDVPQIGYITKLGLDAVLYSKIQNCKRFVDNGGIGNASTILHEMIRIIDWSEKSEIDVADFKVIAETLNDIICLSYEGHSPQTFWDIGII